MAKIIRTLVFLPAKNVFSQLYPIFCCSASVGNISYSFQTFILLPQRSDLHHIQSVWNDMKKQNKLRQTESRRTVATVSKTLQETTCKNSVQVQREGWSHQMLIWLIKVPLLWLMKGSYLVLGVPNNRLRCMQGQKTLLLSYIIHLFLTNLLNDSFFQTPFLCDAAVIGPIGLIFMSSRL